LFPARESLVEVAVHEVWDTDRDTGYGVREDVEGKKEMEAMSRVEGVAGHEEGRGYMG
jgi:hypothetical protein